MNTCSDALTVGTAEIGAVSCKKETASKPLHPNSASTITTQAFYFSGNKLVCGCGSFYLIDLDGDSTPDARIRLSCTQTRQGYVCSLGNYFDYAQTATLDSFLNPNFSVCTNPVSPAFGDSLSATNRFSTAPAALLNGHYRDYYQYGYPPDYSGSDTSIHYFGFQKTDSIGTRCGWLSLDLQEFIYLRGSE